MGVIKNRLSILLTCVLALLFLASPTFADVSTDINGIWTAKSQGEDFFTARASLESATNVLIEELSRFAEIKTSGSFNTIPTEVRDAMLRWETIFKKCRDDLQKDAEIVKIYQWRPE